MASEKKQKLTPTVDNPLFKSRSVNDQSRNRNRGDIHDEFDDEWQDPLAWTVKQVGELQQADLRRNKGEQYAVIVQDQTEEDQKTETSISWYSKIFKTAKSLFSSDDDTEEEKPIGPNIKTYKCYFPDGPDQCLPIVHMTMAKTEENLKSNPEQLERIDRITTFMVKSEDVDCTVNDSVYIDFQNRENFESGIITQKIATSSGSGDTSGPSVLGAFRRTSPRGLPAGLKWSKSGLPPVLEKVTSMGFKINSEDYHLNLIGIRTKNGLQNEFDDWLFCVFKIDGKWTQYRWPITTDPGTYWLENPMNPRGTAIVVADRQYLGAYRIGTHGKGDKKYHALSQAGTLAIHVDDDRDNKINYNAKIKNTGPASGINFHRSSTNEGGSSSVNKWSAGCQVFQDPWDFDNLMELCHQQVEKNSRNHRFNYTLLNEWIPVAELEWSGESSNLVASAETAAPVTSSPESGPTRISGSSRFR